MIKLSEGQTIYEKKIDLPVNGSEFVSYKVNILARHDELITQRIKRDGKLILQVLCKNLLSISNEQTPLYNCVLE